MKIISAIVLLVFLTGFLGWSSVKAKQHAHHSTGLAYGCPLFGTSCNSHCKGENFFDGFCDGLHHGTCYCSEP
ncbi:defensin BmKDfsin6-like [Dermacentor variabilis]|uniref:defensin BmKDfsin6-like n=1 Tax=Dermacentor variabilis TaxID=34621 RepID=UPI003F5C2BF3